MSPFCLRLSVCLPAGVLVGALHTAAALGGHGSAACQYCLSLAPPCPRCFPMTPAASAPAMGAHCAGLGCAIVLCLCLCCWRMQVIQSVASGMRLPVPDDAPPVVRELMASCFATDPVARPTMQQITDALAAVAPSQLPVAALALPPNSTSESSSKHGSSRASSSGGSERRKAARRRERNGSAKEQPLEDLSAPLMLKEPV